MKHKIMNFEDYKASLTSSKEIAFVEALRLLTLKHLPTFTETFQYGFPVYDGKGKFGFAIKKNYVSLYFHHYKVSELVEKHKAELGTYSFGKDTLRFKKISDVPIDVIENIILDLFEY